MKQLRKDGVRRRRFLKAVPAAVAGGLAMPALAQPPAQEQARRISKDMLECGEKIFGVDFSDAEEEQALAGVNRNLESYEQLRAIDVPLDTEPAVTFRPYLPGKKPKPGATPGAKIKVTLQAPSARSASLDDLAFLPVTALAPLVQRREVSSTDLTKMYLDRLKKFGPKLNCVVTLTEDLALAQAAQADKEIRAGKYRGPLHGIPWGGKDLFATKGIPTTWGAGPFQNQVFDYDATIVERLRDAGAVLVAKLSMGALAQGDRWFRGQTRTPWNPENGASGSSAGPGSATAAGLVGFSIGTETRGSIISPSAVNGVTGLRPDLRPRQPSRRDGAQLDDGQDRSDVPIDRGLRARLQRHLRPGRPRRHRGRRAVRLESGRAAREAEDRLHQVRVRGRRRPTAEEDAEEDARVTAAPAEDVATGAAAAACHRKNSGGAPKNGWRS